MHCHCALIYRILFSFYPRGTSDARVLAIIVCLCVCLCVCVCVCVTRRYCIKAAKRRITHITPRDSPGTIVFWRQKSLVDDPLFPWNLRSEWPTPFKNHIQFRSIFAHSDATVRAGEKVQIALIGSRPRAFQRAIDEPWTLLPLSPPKGGSKREFLHLALPFISSLQVIIDISNLICGLNMSKSQPMDDKLSLKGVWSLSRDVFSFRKISDNISKTVQ